MRPSSFFIETRKLFPHRSWHWMIVALRQDPVVFKQLAYSEFGKDALASLPAVPELWTPASLCIYALGNPIEINKIRIQPLQPLPENLRKEASRAYEKWYRTKSSILTLEDAGLIALSLRERLRIKGSWKGFSEEIREHLGSLDTVLACLYGLIPEPKKMIEELISQENIFQYSNLVIHIILSNPLPPEEQLTELYSIFRGKSLPLILMVLEHLELERPPLAKALANEIIDEIPLSDYIDSVDENTYTNLNVHAHSSYEERISRLTRLLRYITLQDYADKPGDLATTLNESIEITENLQAQFHAQLAQNISKNQIGTNSIHDQLKIWKKATQIVPNEPKYIVGLATALIASGRLDDARAYLEARQVDLNMPLNPLILLTAAEVAYRQNDIASAKETIISVLEYIEDGEYYLGGDYLRLAKLLSGLDMDQDAESVLKSGYSRYPNYPELLAPLIQLQLQVGKLDEGLEKSYLAFALEGVSSIGSSHTVVVPEMRNLLINSLETNGEWGAALEERIACVEMKESPSPKDFHDLSRCAIKAKELQQAINASKKAIELDGKDGIAFNLLGKALLDSGEVKPALEYLQKATRLAPSSTSAWINLADAYKIDGEESLFFNTLNAAIHAVPESPEIYYSLGTAYVSKESLTMALDNFSKAINQLHSSVSENEKRYYIDEQTFIQNPDLAMGISLNTGNTLRELGYLDDARFLLGHAYKIGTKLYGLKENDNDSIQIKDKRYIEIAYSYGQILMDSGEYSQAVEVLEFVVSQKRGAIQPKLDYVKSLLLTKPSNEYAEKAIDILLGAFDLNLEGDYPEMDAYPSISEEEKAEAQVLFAEALAISGDYENARDAFRKALETPFAKDPNWKARVSIGLGRVALVLNEPEMALAALQEAEQLQKEDANIYKLLSQAYLETGLIDDSYTTSKKVLEFSAHATDDIGWFTNHLVQIADQLKFKNIDQIIDGVKILENAINENPENQYYLIQLAKLQMISGDIENAVLTLKSAIDQKIGFKEVTHHEVLEIVNRLKELEELGIAGELLQSVVDLEYSKKSIESNQDRRSISILLIELSDIYLSMGNQNSALLSLDQAIDIDPENPAIYHRKAIRMNDLSEFEDAELFIHDALVKFPNDISLHQDAAKLYYSSGDLYKALGYFESLFSNFEASSSLENLNGLYLQASEIAAASLLQEKALEYLHTFDFEGQSKEQQFTAYCMLAELEAADGIGEMGIEAFQKAQSLFPNHPRIIPLKARIIANKDSLNAGLEVLSEFSKDNAIEKLEDQIRSDLINPYILQRCFGEAYLELGDWNRAVEIFGDTAKNIPHEPLSHFLFAKAIILRAEAQLLSQLFNVSNHTPGEEALEASSYDSFKRSINRVFQQINQNDFTDIEENSNLTTENAMNLVEKWKARGYSVFESSFETTNEFKNHLNTFKNSNKDVAAYLLKLSQFDRIPMEYETMLSDLGIGLGNQELNDKPLILVALAHLIYLREGGKALNFVLRAEELIKNEIELLPLKFPILHSFISMLALQNKEYSLALQAIHKALDEWPDEPFWHCLASEIYRSNDQKNGLPDLNQASLYLEKAIQLEPQQLSFYCDLGQTHMLNGEFASAVTVFGQAAQINPKDGEIWLRLAEAQMHAGFIDLAASSTAKAIENSDDPVKPLLLRGEIDLQNNNPKGAYQIAEELLEKLPDNLDALLMLSKALVLLDRSEEALKLLKESIPEGSDSLRLKLEYVNLLANCKGINSAIPEITRIYSANPNKPQVLAVLADIHYQSGQLKEAVGSALRALKIDDGELTQETKANLHYIMGQQYHDEGQLDQAIHHLIYAERLNPKDVEILQELGQVYHKRRQYEDAMRYYQMAIDISPNNYYPYYLIGLLLKDKKDYAGAENAIRKASQLEPSDMDVHRMLSAVSALNLIHNKRLVPNEMAAPS